jgi:diacylglycerol O-acyltransferase / wax synthase
VPGPQMPLYLLGRRMLDPFPMVPLVRNQALGIALLSYDGRINFGLVGDFDLLWDIDELAEDVEESLAELAAAAGVELGARDRVGV